MIIYSPIEKRCFDTIDTIGDIKLIIVSDSVVVTASNMHVVPSKIREKLQTLIIKNNKSR